MKQIFLVSFVIASLGLLCGFPSPDMIGRAVAGTGTNENPLATLVVLSVFACPLSGLALLAQHTARLFMKGQVRKGRS